MDQEARWRAGWRPHEDFMKIPLTPDWLKELRRQYPWKGEGLIVVSLFDGMGGCWQALKELGVPIKKGYSCEIKDFANEVTKARFPEIIHLGSVADVTCDMIPEPVDLIVAGFPCQDLSRMGNMQGLHGSRSGLFFHIPRLISILKAKWFLVENVKCRWQDQAEVTKHLLGVLPMELDAEELSPQSRVRYYWTNLPLPRNLPGIRNSPETSVQHFLKTAIAPFAKSGTVLTTNSDANTSRVALKCVYDMVLGGARYIEVDEIETMMGYPYKYSDIPFKEKGGTAKTLPSPSSKKQSGAGHLIEGGCSEGASNGNEEGQPRKRLKYEEGADDAAGIARHSEKEEGNGAGAVEEPTGEVGKGIITLSSDEEDLGWERAHQECAALGDGTSAPGAHPQGADSDGDAGGAEPLIENALPLTLLPEPGRPTLDEAGSSGLSNEEKSRGNTERYGLRARKPVNYTVEHVELDDKTRASRRQTLKRRIRSSPRRSGETLSAPRELRWELLGNSFVVPCIALMLAPLLNPQLRARAERIEQIPTPAVQDACLFKEGEVWALYNEDVAPNWYARVTSVDTIRPKWDGRKKICPRFALKYRFYEFPSKTNAGPVLGTGVLQLASEEYSSFDDSFSHRMDPVFLDPEGERILVYPKPGDVWVVKDGLDKFSRFKMHVYIVDSNVDESTGGYKCVVRSMVLQARPTRHVTLYRVTEEERVISGGRMVFSYQVPYFYKNDAGLLYVEPHQDQIAKRAKESESDGDEDDVAEEDQELEQEEEVPVSKGPTTGPPTDAMPKLLNFASTSQALRLLSLRTNPVREQQPRPALEQAQQVPSVASRKGKEKVDLHKENADDDEVAGVLPSEGRGQLEQRPRVKRIDVHLLMDALPQVAPLYHGRFLPRELRSISTTTC